MTSATRPGNPDQVAVFIDFENLAIGAAMTLPDQANPVPYAALELVCRDYGNASIRRAYADWAKPQFGKYQQDLAMNGVDLIQIQRFGIAQKNAADIRMAVDANRSARLSGRRPRCQRRRAGLASHAVGRSAAGRGGVHARGRTSPRP